MCGIAGIYNYHSPTEPSIEVNVKNMLSLIHHRGPDESGTLVDQNLGIGSVRLSIIDLSSGQQPMSDVSGRYWIVYNGEIFNYPELRADLIKQGIQLKTTCDTEIVVQMFALYGPKCLSQFNGQFAFCILDRQTKELFLARDRVGIRPLFYWQKNESFAFCSEIKGLLCLDQVERALDEQSLSEIFTFWTSISPKTPFKGILELQPGHYMTVNSEGIKTQKYWSLQFSPEEKKPARKLQDAMEELDSLLHDAVKIRLRADVPVGAYLSGGLDSSVTTSYIKSIYPEVLNTFSIGFANHEYDESGFQNEAARFFGTNHTAFSCRSEEIAENFEDTVYHTEFPILRTSPTPMFMLSRKVRQNNIKVVITGEGADEVFGGYNIFKEAKIRQFWAKQPASKIRPRLLTKLYPYLPLMKDSPEVSLRMFFGYKLTETENPFYSHLLRWNNTGRLKSFFSDDIIRATSGHDAIEQLSGNLPEGFDQWSELSKAQYIETQIFMSGYLLSSQGDRVAMGNSVEGRYPFLDYRVIEFGAKLPDRYKLNGIDEKYILKKLSNGRIPDSISQRSKQAYRAPISDSFFNQQVPDRISYLISEEAIKSQGIFDGQKVKTLVEKMRLGKQASEIDQMAVVGVISTQLMSDLFIKNRVKPQPSVLQNYRTITISGD